MKAIRDARRRPGVAAILVLLLAVFLGVGCALPPVPPTYQGTRGSLYVVLVDTTTGKPCKNLLGWMFPQGDFAPDNHGDGLIFRRVPPGEYRVRIESIVMETTLASGSQWGHCVRPKELSTVRLVAGRTDTLIVRAGPAHRCSIE
jgi:hypothetical protein